MAEIARQRPHLCVVTDQLPAPPRNGITLPVYNYLALARQSATVSVCLVWDAAEPLPLAALAENEALYGPIHVVYVKRRGRVARIWRELFGLDMYQHGWSFATVDAQRLRSSVHGLLMVSPMSAVAKWRAILSSGNAVVQPHVAVAAVNDCTTAEYHYRQLSVVGGLGTRAKAWLDRLRSPFIARIERSLLAPYATVFVQTQADKRAMAELVDAATAERCVLVPNGVREDLFHLQCQPSQTVLFVGELSGEYGPVALWMCRELWPLVRARCPSAKLLLVGRGATETLQQFVAQSAGVRHLPFAPDLADVYAQTGLVLSPVFKGFGLINKTLEAMAAGLPVVGGAAAFNGIAGFEAGRHAAVVGSLRADQFAQQICRLLTDSEAALSMGGAARNLVRGQFRWERAGDVIEQLANSRMFTAAMPAVERVPSSAV